MKSVFLNNKYYRLNKHAKLQSSFSLRKVFVPLEEFEILRSIIYFYFVIILKERL